MSALCLSLFLCLNSQSLAASDGEAGWKAGTARACITPDKPMWMAGYASRNHPAEGTIHDIWVKSLALEDAKGNRSVIITGDVVGFPKVIYENICKEAKEKFALDRSQIMLNGSHTHSGPLLRESPCYPIDDEQKDLVKVYRRGLEEKVVGIIGEALSEMRPVKLWAGEGVCTFAVNRRNNKEAEVPGIIERGEALKGPVDHSVPVLAVRTTDGELMTVLFGYACHNTTLSLYQWCGDYAGSAQIALEKNHPGTNAMFFIGAGADQNPIPRRTVELCEKYGDMLAASVDEALGKEMRPISPALRMSFEFVELGFDRNPTREELESMKPEHQIRARWIELMLEKMDKGEELAKSYPYPVQVWKLGDDQLLISMGGEVFVDYSLNFKSKYGRNTWLMGYTNDVMAYIPTHACYEEGGYGVETLYMSGWPTERWASDIEERITASVDRLVQKVNN